MEKLNPPQATYEAHNQALVLGGAWTFGYFEELQRQLDRIGTSTIRAIDGAKLERLDTAGALAVLTFTEKRKLLVQNLPSDDREILELVRERLRGSGHLRVQEIGMFEKLGRSTVELGKDLVELLGFIGKTFLELFRTFFHPRLIRPKEFFVHLEQTCVNAIPIASLVMFLIGVVLAYLSSIQAQKYGANIFVVDALALATCRELSPVIVAIIVAGRSGSAFTAHIGAMKLNEEIDAMQTMGLSVERVLIIPRVLALIVALPILVFIGDLIGLLGGMLICDLRLDITGPTFLQRLHEVLPLRSFLVGLVKAPVFAVFIAIIGCKMGLTVENNARALGLSTTSTVVQSIVSVILLNAGFAILFQELGI